MYLAGAKRKEKQALPLRVIQHTLIQAFLRSPVLLDRGGKGLNPRELLSV